MSSVSKAREDHGEQNFLAAWALRHWGKLAFLLIAPWCILHFYNHPNWDDYCYLYEASKNSLSEQLGWVGNLNSRYLSNLLISYQPSLYLGDWVYGTITFLMFGMFLLLWRTLLDVYLKPKFLGPLWLLSSVLLLRQLYEPAETFYWIPAVMTYLVPLKLLMAYLIWGKDQIFASTGYGLKTFFIPTGLSILFVLLGEQFLVMGAGGLLLLLAWHFMSFKKWRWDFAFAFFVSIGLMLYVLLQPGNVSRSATSTESFQIGASLFKSFRDFIVIQARILEPGNLVLILVFGLFFISREGVSSLETERKSASSNLQPWYLKIFGVHSELPALLLTFAWVGLSITGSLLNYLAFGGDGIVSRSLNIGFIVSLFFWLFLLKGPLGDFVRNWGGYLLRLPRSVVVVLVLYALFSNHIFASFKEAFWVGPRYYAAMSERESFVESEARNKQELVILPSVQPIPELVIYTDLDPDPKHSSNVCYAELHGLKRVKALR